MQGIVNKVLSMKELETLSDEDLIEIYRLSNPAAIEVLVQRYKAFVRAKIRSNFFVGADKEDLIQEGMIGLFKAICDYDVNKEASFKSFATICITRQLSTAFKTATRQKHIPLNTSISLNSPIHDEEDEGITLMDMIKEEDMPTPEDLIIHQEGLLNLESHIEQLLSGLEWEVLQLHTEGKNYHEIAKEMGKGEKTIDNALQRIKRKLANMIESTTKASG